MSPWFPQSLEVLAGVSRRLESGQQAAIEHGARPGPQSQDARPHLQVIGAIKSERAGLRQRLRSDVWLQAYETLSILLPNTLVVIACAWLINFVFASGNVFSGRLPADQSDFEFFAAVAILGHVIFYWVLLLTHTHVMVPMQFVKLQDTGNPQASILFCIRRLLRHSFITFLVSTLLLGASLLVCDAASSTLKDWKVEYYACAFFAHVYTSSITVAVRRIFQQETVQGQSISRSSYSTTLWGSLTSFMKISVKTSGKMFAGIFAGMYVQLASHRKITGSWNFAAYTLGSLLLKILIKEVAKFGVMKLNIKDPRSIFAAVGLPTVLIDTQVRVMLQRGQSVNFTILWTVGMAVFEVATRLTKVLFTRRELRRKEIAMLLHERLASSTGTVLVGTPSLVKKPSATRVATLVALKAAHANATARVAPNVSSPAIEFERWKRQTLAFQIAESYANMSAEYIAMGCSTSILYFYWSHPKYELSGDHVGSSLHQSISLESWSRGYTICGQVAVEIFVDFISCALEISIGIDFRAVRRFRGYLGLLFTSIAVLNIQICALIYFKDRQR
ncbi:hypothetical protein Gpo141_00008649 [Globisporangium polare]